MSKQSRPARGSRRRSRRRRGCASFLQGLLTNDVERLDAGRGALRGAADAAGQDPVRHDRRARARRRRRGLSPRLRARRRRPISPSGSASTSCAPRSRSPTRAPSRAVVAFWGGEPAAVERRPCSTPIRAIRASAGGRSCRAPSAAAIGDGARRDYEALRIGARSRRRAASISPMATPSRTTPTSTSCTASISTRAATSARRSSRA